MYQHNFDTLTEGLSCYVGTHPSTGGKALFSAADFQPGEVMGRFGAREVFRKPSRMTLQVSNQRHILLRPIELEYTNHSCDPNLFFDTTDMVLRCLRPIAAGDELSFFYPSTEWKMATPFECSCGSGRCIGRISGAADLPASVLAKYRLTDFINRKLAQKVKSEQ